MERHWQMPVSAAQTLAWVVHRQAETNDKLISHRHYYLPFSNSLITFNAGVHMNLSEILGSLKGD